MIYSFLFLKELSFHKDIIIERILNRNIYFLFAGQGKIITLEKKVCTSFTTYIQLRHVFFVTIKIVFSVRNA